MAPFRLSRLRSRSEEEAAPSGTQDETAVNLRELDATKAVHLRAPRPSRTDLECLSDSQALSESGSDSIPVPSSPPTIPPSPPAHTPMAKTLSFARGRRPSKEELTELYAAAPDEVLSPGSAQVLRSALQAEADEGIAASLVCPITSELITDPVFTMDGQVTQTQTQTLALTPTLTLALTLTLTLTRRTSARPSRRGCATTTPRPPPASRCPTRSSSRTYAREACCGSYPSGRSGRRRASV